MKTQHQTPQHASQFDRSRNGVNSFWNDRGHVHSKRRYRWVEEDVLQRGEMALGGWFLEPRLVCKKELSYNSPLYATTSDSLLDGLKLSNYRVQTLDGAGVPVIGARLSGIAELVRDGVGGILVEDPASTSAWTDTLRRLTEDPRIKMRMRESVLTPMRMSTVAKEMAKLYGEYGLNGTNNHG